jgi:hypothetical protein
MLICVAMAIRFGIAGSQFSSDTGSPAGIKILMKAAGLER